MGIKGRRVHMIEELSETIISFQRGKTPAHTSLGLIELYNNLHCVLWPELIWTNSLMNLLLMNDELTWYVL
jgi:hypothetical protein